MWEGTALPGYLGTSVKMGLGRREGWLKKEWARNETGTLAPAIGAPS